MLTAAAIMVTLLGVVHSILGEVIIFNKLRKRAIVPNADSDLFTARRLGIVWASWHVVTVFGWGVAGILWYLASPSFTLIDSVQLILLIISVAMFLSALLVCFATKGKHPGWIVLLAISVLATLP